MTKKVLSIGAAMAMFAIAGCGDGKKPASAEAENENDRSNIAIVQGIVADYVKETVAEAEDADTIFTDGPIDEELRKEIKRRNMTIQVCSMFSSSWSKESFAEKMRNGAAAQIGYELLTRSGEDSASMQLSGVLFRLKGMSDSVRLDGIKSAGRLATRILDFYEKNAIDSLDDEDLKNKFLFVQWRIARIARLRAEALVRAGDAKGAGGERWLADALDEKNSALKKVLENMKGLMDDKLSQMSPRECLRYALVRADFKSARPYAEKMLTESPDDVDANFAVGMSCFMEKRYHKAEEYLKRCISLKPTEPAFLNNLAVLQMRLGRYDEARKNALKALELIPDSADVKDTLREIDESEKNSRQPRQ